jgi:nucleotide-binding universal stress UspA family protein
MSIKSILVVPSGDAGDAARLDQAFVLAEFYRAQVTVLHVKPSPVTYVASTEFMMPASVIADMQALIDQTAAKVEAQTRSAAARAGAEIDWRCEEGDEAIVAAVYSHYSDLAVVAPVLAREFVFAASGPVVAVPDGARARIPKRILIAWNGSREAARAVRDAMPILAQADRVDILVVDPPGDRPIGQDLARLLARHGIAVELRERIAGKVEAEAVILEEARTAGADLLVMGAYGHSRLREWVLGGATEEALRNTVTPVLLAH